MNIAGAIVAGLVGTVIMSIALANGPQMGMPKMDFPGLLSTLFTATPHRALGWGLHLLIGVLWALVYAAVWSAGIGSPDVTIGLLFGIVHWLIAGALIGLLPAVHAGIRAGAVRAPGAYLLNLGGGTRSVGFFGGLMGHIIFGLTVALVYQFFAR